MNIKRFLFNIKENMKTFITLLYLSLISYSLSAVTDVALELKASQSVNAGSNVKFKITVTVVGDDATAANDKQKIKSIAGIQLVKSDNAEVKSAVTCAIEETEVVRGTPKDFDCTATSLSTVGNYKLAKVSDNAFKVKDDSDTDISVASVTGTVTMEVKEADTTGTKNTEKDDEEDNGKFLKVSSLVLLLFFF